MMNVYYIPNGPRNIQAMFPTVNFKLVAEYYLEIQDNLAVVIATTPINLLTSDCCGNNRIRIHFLNYLGTIDAVNFNLITDEHEAKSDSSRQPITIPLVKQNHAINRFNVTSNNTLTLSCTDYREENMKWLDELIDSPLIFLEWSGEQGQPADYIPLIMQDIKKVNFKRDDRWLYEIIVQVKLSHERIVIRN